jgi:hypothetical protein
MTPILTITMLGLFALLAFLTTKLRRSALYAV